MILSVLLYSGAFLAFVGLITLVIPIRRIGIPTRRRALAVLASGALGVLIALFVPASESSVAQPQSRLDEFHPRWQFNEYHETLVAASPAAVYQAIKQTTASEITFFQTLTSIRRFGQPGPESILNAPEHQPILDVALKSGFRLLADDPDREIVVATLVHVRDRSRVPKTPAEYAALDAIPGFAKATMNFRIEPAGSQTRVTTETRVYATDAESLRAFQTYWRVIYPGSSIIRSMWLRAIRRRAEKPTARQEHE